MTGEGGVRAEFSRPIAADQLDEQGLVREIEATAEERAALSKRFGLLQMDRLTARVRLRRARGGLIRVTGRFEAAVTQSCVVTLQPVPARLAEEFSTLFAAAPAAAGREVAVDPLAEDPPEPIMGGRIDIGETVVQHLAVALDPYPRAPGAALSADPGRTGGDASPGGPFEPLRRLRRD